MEHEVVDKAREVKKAGNIYIPGEPKVAFVMRICGIIIKLNKVTKNLLRITAPTSPGACLSSPSTDTTESRLRTSSRDRADAACRVQASTLRPVTGASTTTTAKTETLATARKRSMS
ncbi:uncharacterized protein LOC119770786 [Culex quinquefasciatus]|uniref:uncharacterized protein LOC119770786 n=1 Tax=Culex quinquefasciatus TaxID=7176 RepID=UPI0018E35A83|nr:uncharacterized protein LOC119770786 [Culex quinquefasciatus]